MVPFQPDPFRDPLRCGWERFGSWNREDERGVCQGSRGARPAVSGCPAIRKESSLEM